MLFTRLPEKKYILGIDLEESFCQISYLNTRRFSAGMDPHTFSFVAGREEFNIPSAAFQDPGSGQWLYGRDALNTAAERGLKPLTGLLGLAREEELSRGQKIKAEGASNTGAEGTSGGLHNGGAAAQNTGAAAGSGFYAGLLAGYLRYCLSLLSVEVTPEETEAVTFTTAVMDRTNAAVLKRAAESLYPDLSGVSFEEHLKSFYHYILMQDEEQRRQSVLLLDGWSETELVLSCLSFNKKTKPVVCIPEEYRIPIPEDADGAQMDRTVFDAVRALMHKKEFSAAYLTGESLSGGWMKDSLNLIARGRRAFQGDNLYSKGAAFSTLVYLGLAAKADKFFYLSMDALRCNIGMNCLKKGRTVYQPLLDAGSEWYDAAAQIDILLEDGDEIVLSQTSVDTGIPRDIIVKLENLPQRPRATTRLRIRLSMRTANLMKIEAEDLGFGEIFPSSGMRWEQEIDING